MLCVCVCVFSHLRYVTLDPLSIRQDVIPHDYTPCESLWEWREKQSKERDGYTRRFENWKMLRYTQKKGTPTLSSRNSGLMKSSRNQVSGGFSQSAMDLVDKSRKGQGGVNILLHHLFSQSKDGVSWGRRKTGTSWPSMDHDKWSYWEMTLHQVG